MRARVSAGARVADLCGVFAEMYGSLADVESALTL